jgi:hypothetical protein
MAAGEQRHQDFFDYFFLTDDPLGDFSAQTRSRREKILAGR